MGKAGRSGQRGGTFAGLVLGVVVGLGIAFVVAAYVSKVPVPFLSSGSRLADQDAKEAERNKDWNPNAGLVTNAGSKPAAAPSPAPAPAGHETTVPAASDDPLGDLARARAQGSAPESMATAAAPASAAAAPAAPAAATGNYYIQAGAFRAPDEADAQRAQLAMLGWEARVSEGQQNGRAVYRVRIGPFARRDDAEQLKGKLDGAGITSILVRVSASR
ncbi:SPOR domain-containing protein [Comamonas sp. NLF-1-9]|uniref:SPOR domain-containing protein n=1 Tax=Comamonas sp. NLF-1-9 TaxID=2853163 RepID=UPI001C46DF4E|nr:SPOR domain-containing protein [Comamonas sp. NLF-1-9]QXL83841.1 SPOR domain-containing protein [Comamonas sp. NLF-1-9]